MAQPDPYTPSYNFTGFQNNAPTSPLPAPQLDNELLSVAVSIATLVSSVENIRRADGALNNGIVTYDSLSLALKLMLDPTNATLVAGAVAAAQAAASSASGSSAAAAISAAAALVSEINAAASAVTVNLSLYLAKSNNLAGLGSLVTSRANLGLGSAAVFDVGVLAGNIIQLNGSAKLPAVDGSLLTNIDVLPVGAMIWSTGSAALPGTIKANGALISRASFARLTAFSIGGTGLSVSEATWLSGTSGAYSTGDLTTTIRVPDVRGEFIRGFDDGRSVDTGRGFGMVQLDSLKSHTHTSNAVANNGTAVVGAANFAQPTYGAGATIDATGGTETRPRNIPMVACIKY